MKRKAYNSYLTTGVLYCTKDAATGIKVRNSC